MTDIQVIRQWTNEVQTDLIENYKRLGLKASGNWANELENRIEVKTDGYNIKILAAPYTGVMTGGRKPNKNQSKEALRKWIGWAGSTIIKDWVKLKGINANPFAIAYKIAREGIKVPNSNNPGTLVNDVITPKKIAALTKGLGTAYVDNLKSEVKNALKSN